MSKGGGAPLRKVVPFCGVCRVYRKVLVYRHDSSPINRVDRKFAYKLLNYRKLFKIVVNTQFTNSEYPIHQ